MACVATVSIRIEIVPVWHNTRVLFWWSECMHMPVPVYLCLSVCLSVCLPIYLYIYPLQADRPACLHACLPVCLQAGCLPVCVRAYVCAVPWLTETNPKYRNETEIPERNIKAIGEHIQVYRCDVDLPKRPLNNDNKLLGVINNWGLG